MPPTMFTGLILLGFLQISICMEVPKCSPNETRESCCPCYHNNTSCTTACPTDYLPVLQRVRCEGEPVTTSPVPSLTTVTPDPGENNGTNSTVEPLLDTTTEKPEYPEILTCLQKCPEHQFYDSNQSRCLECHPACLNCSGAGELNCLTCKYTHGNVCVSDCPPGYKRGSRHSDGSVICEVVDDGEDSNLAVILGASIGGVVVIIAIIMVVVVIIVCRRRRNAPVRRSGDKTTERTRMSEIIQERTNTKKKDEKSYRPAPYQNTNTLPVGTNLGREIEQGHDKVTRYTTDPTTGKPVLQEPQSMEEEHPYGNHTIINIHRTSDTTDMSPTQIEELVQLEQLGHAPSPPGSSHSLPGHASSPPGHAHSLPGHASSAPGSAPHTKPGRAGKQKKVTTPVHEAGPTEDYMDMTGEADLEPYENFTFVHQKVADDKMKSKNSKTGKNTNGVSANKGGDSEMEIYENVEEPMKKGGSLKNNENRKDVNASAAKCEAVDEEENYENTGTLKKNDQEIYENWMKS